MSLNLQKAVILFVGALLFGASVNGAISAEYWRCELDLHQGDTGVLEFTRSGSTIEGRTVVTRNTGAGPFEHNISGSWLGEVIEFRRVLNPPTSHQDFKGIAVRTEDATNRASDMHPDDPKVRMAGRFAFKYNGIWSADCRLGPKTYRTGKIEIRQTFMADLDEGVVASGTVADIWFQAKTAQKRYIVPRNGALIAIAGTQSIGRDGCAALDLSNQSISLNDVPVGTYVCVKTTEGRYSQFRVNEPVGPSPGILKIGFTTWE